jgi:hypothetical protein
MVQAMLYAVSQNKESDRWISDPAEHGGWGILPGGQNEPEALSAYFPLGTPFK